MRTSIAYWGCQVGRGPSLCGPVLHGRSSVTDPFVVTPSLDLKRLDTNPLYGPRCSDADLMDVMSTTDAVKDPSGGGWPALRAVAVGPDTLMDHSCTGRASGGGRLALSAVPVGPDCTGTNVSLWAMYSFSLVR